MSHHTFFAKYVQGSKFLRKWVVLYNLGTLDSYIEYIGIYNRWENNHLIIYIIALENPTVWFIFV